jgi:hypothetical protein
MANGLGYPQLRLQTERAFLDLFNSADTNRDGIITAKERAQYIQQQGGRPTAVNLKPDHSIAKTVSNVSASASCLDLIPGIDCVTLIASPVWIVSEIMNSSHKRFSKDGVNLEEYMQRVNETTGQDIFVNRVMNYARWYAETCVLTKEGNDGCIKQLADINDPNANYFLGHMDINGFRRFEGILGIDGKALHGLEILKQHGNMAASDYLITMPIAAVILRLAASKNMRALNYLEILTRDGNEEAKSRLRALRMPC